MAYSVHSSHGHQTADLTIRLLQATARRIAAAEMWYRRAQSRRIIAALSPEQMKDIGYPAVDAIPSLDVEAGLMSRLQSMR
ncbi:DUF1127 domain-containing protein [Aminobacter sp. NyZ550]|jgi:uncharacterized protein YjiS (DUF1127 family)|uniref:Uncharacterized protein YjiS (DUF1127 family) n=1 Tax=Aminobacter ciceronei TaxID=150723 RepID=A0ABR6C645_9HYPH|nr:MULTISPECIES: DUF1127 domain-containing protein [Aminobacter]WMC96891.1 DUF1127 domain-containing protein [Aminobacter aminovorans]MBA8906417.1 uncharacterized protein YjiS (DUF1127 family) [Aminobacter ciceronei]MBA9020196.1 uncharacterized protein YjiS (DUF1127 family) [Aminobacter ciceronei]QNH35286.1 DUF1127 domain-containing protein [Aminobacter sp. MDW-2]QOF69220.1 DUF1127 domain-containing protein [Aminobacter sp. SR38]